MNTIIPLIVLPLVLSSCSARETGTEAGQEPDETVAEITVMSYNMLFEHKVPEQTERRWVSRCPNLTSSILSLAPDIIGAQELLSWQVADVCRLTGYKRVGKSLSGSVSDTDSNENECIFYNPARLECLEWGSFWFNTHPYTPGPAEGTTYNRMCNWGRFRDLKTRKVFYLFNSHFYYETPVYRDACASVLVDKIGSLPPAGAKIILTGDFNADESENCIKAILKAGYKDSRSLAEHPGGPAGSYYAFDFSTSPTAYLDHVLVNKEIAVESFEIVDTQFKTRKIESDHLPVLVKIQF